MGEFFSGSRRMIGIFLLLVTSIVSLYAYDAFRQPTNERDAILSAIQHADSITCYVPIAKETHQHRFEDSQSLSRLRALIRLEHGTRNRDCHVLSDGGLSVEFNIETPDHLRIRVSPFGIFTYRVQNDGRKECFQWHSDEKTVHELATECGFVWPLLNDAFGQ